ncbi:MAG: LamG domain-containing protein, partial [Planctomycetaceae bacterium]|nr:LamG domain-containing protein [Planctomycetaceae bacterium]
MIDHIKNVTISCILGMLFAFHTSAISAKEVWHFGEPADQTTEKVSLIVPIERQGGNLSVPANEIIKERTKSQAALKNPRLKCSGDVEQFEIAGKSWSLSGWFHHTIDDGSMVGGIELVGTRQPTSHFHGWDICMIDGTMRFLFSRPDGTEIKLQTKNRFDDGNWHFFQLRWDAPKKTVDFYADGKEVGSANNIVPITECPNRLFSIGAKVDEKGNTLHEWTGEIDHWIFEADVVAPVESGDFPVADTTVKLSTIADTSNIHTVLLSGQTAILWDEHDCAVRSILFSDKPITEENRGDARLLVDNILHGSSND